MTNFRKVIIEFIKSKLGDIAVFDASQDFKIPNDDFATYYILNISDKSQNNNIDGVYKPLTMVTLQIDIRGNNSFDNMLLLSNSIFTLNTIDVLKTNGVHIISKGQISPLPMRYGTKQQEGYIMDISFTVDNTFEDLPVFADNIFLEKV